MRPWWWRQAAQGGVTARADLEALEISAPGRAYHRAKVDVRKGFSWPEVSCRGQLVSGLRLGRQLPQQDDGPSEREPVLRPQARDVLKVAQVSGDQCQVVLHGNGGDLAVGAG